MPSPLHPLWPRSPASPFPPWRGLALAEAVSTQGAAKLGVRARRAPRPRPLDDGA